MLLAYLLYQIMHIIILFTFNVLIILQYIKLCLLLFPGLYIYFFGMEQFPYSLYNYFYMGNSQTAFKLVHFSFPVFLLGSFCYCLPTPPIQGVNSFPMCPTAPFITVLYWKVEHYSVRAVTIVPSSHIFWSPP